jgi:hypothetical protein
MDKARTIDKIHRRQLARLLDHLAQTGQSTDRLTQDIKRSYGYAFCDVKAAITQENDKETEGHDNQPAD